MLRAKVYLKDENHSLVCKVIEAAKIRNSVDALGQGDIKHDNGFLFEELGKKIDKIEGLLTEKHCAGCKEDSSITTKGQPKKFVKTGIMDCNNIVTTGIIEEEKKPAKKKKGKKPSKKKETKEEVKETETKEEVKEETKETK